MAIMTRNRDYDFIKNNNDDCYNIRRSSHSGSTSSTSSQSGDSGLGSPSSYSAFNKVFSKPDINANYSSNSNASAPNFSPFNDFLGLSKLLQNVKINEENPLLYQQQNLIQNQNERHQQQQVHKVRRQSFGSDSSDPSTGVEYEYDYNGNYKQPMEGFKQLPPPPPSHRLPKAVRDDIISGAYNYNNRQYSNHRGPVPMPEKFCPPPPPMQRSISPPLKLDPPPPSMGMLPPTHRSQQSNMLCCVFCRNNKESEKVYTSHNLKDPEGRTVCPILRAYTCPICKANGDNSHTIKYCPENQSSRFMNLQPPQQHQQPLPQQPFRLPPPPTSTTSRQMSSGRPMSHMNFSLPPQMPPKIR